MDEKTIQNQQLHEPIYDVCDRLEVLAQDLVSLRKAMRLLGLERAAETLGAAVDEIDGSVRIVKQAMTAIINQDYQNARQNTDNVLDAALAGIKIGQGP